MANEAEVSKFSWFTFEDETNRAGGKTGLIFSMTKLANGDGQSVGMPYVGQKPAMPLTKYERENVRVAGDGETDVHTFNKATAELLGKIPFFLHSNYFLEKALTGTMGDLLDSFVTHWEDRIRRWESFGCNVEVYELTSNPTNFPRQDVSVLHYDTKTATGAETTVDSITKVPFTGTQPIIHKDLKITVDGAALRDFALRLTVTNVFDKTKENGQFFVAYPVLISRDFGVAITTRTLDDTLRQEDQKESDDRTKIIVITGFPSGKTLTLNNMRVDKSNSEIFPSFGMLDFTTPFVMGDNFSYTFV